MIAAYLVFAFVSFGFAWVIQSVIIVSLFTLYDLDTALITDVERAYSSEITSQNGRGSLLDSHGIIAGWVLFLASLITGLLFWIVVSASALIIFVESLAMAVGLTLGFVMNDNRNEVNA